MTARHSYLTTATLCLALACTKSDAIETSIETLAGGQPAMSRHQLPAVQLPREGDFPALDGATEWLNTPALTVAGLRGRVVLVQFWTYSCINWLRTLPYLRAWAEKYAPLGLTVVGVHSPEFEFERNVESVRRAAKEMSINYPIAVDSDHAVWRAFDNAYWPALYFVDAQGVIRHHTFGEGDYERSEIVIQQLLAEAGRAGADRELVSVEGQGVEAAADWGDLKSPENYLGYARTENFVALGATRLGRRRVYAAPARLSLNHWALAGDWTVGRSGIVLNEPGGQILYQFHARDLHLVAGPGAHGAAVRVRVRLDGKPPGDAHGVDLDAEGEGTLTEKRLYQLIRQPKPIVDRRLEIEFLNPGVEAFSFTFG